MNDRFQVPVNFMLRDATRLFLRELTKRADIPCPEVWPLMLWHEWAAQQTVWRPLREPLPDPLSIDWCASNQTLALVELGVFWKGLRGGLVYLAFCAGFLKMEKQGEEWGVVLSEFGQYNPHFAPGHKTMQQRGSEASIEAKARKRDGSEARKQRMLIETQGKLAFDATPEEVEGALALIMSLDRLGRRKQVRLAKECDPALIEKAVQVKRNFAAEDTDRVQRWLLLMRDDPQVMQGAEIVLDRWSEYMERSRP